MPHFERLLGAGAAIVLAGLLVTASAQQPRPRTADPLERPVTIAGCVVAGDKADTYLLKNVSILMGVPPPNVAPEALFFRLNTTKRLKAHVGHRIEVHGIADFSDLDKGKLEVDKTPDGRAKVAVNSERRTVRTTVGADEAPASLAPAGTSGKTAVPVATYKLNVATIKMISSTCQ